MNMKFHKLSGINLRCSKCERKALYYLNDNSTFLKATYLCEACKKKMGGNWLTKTICPKCNKDHEQQCCSKLCPECARLYSEWFKKKQEALMKEFIEDITIGEHGR